MEVQTWLQPPLSVDVQPVSFKNKNKNYSYVASTFVNLYISAIHAKLYVSVAIMFVMYVFVWFE